MGRNAHPIDILKANGKKHLTKAEIEDRKKSEMKTGESKLKAPDYIKNDILAYAKWKEIIKIYKDVDFISSGDTSILSRYCMTFSEYYNLLERKKRIDNISKNCDSLEDYIESSEQFDYRVRKQLIDMISTDAFLRLETAINKKMDMLIKMEDRMFLNPLAKIKNVVKKETPKEPSKFESRFGGV
ncbi:MAG TPA: terminase [Lachnospiraceae bacterium]|nr:terminase [Lachnospiraceae bacterium]